MGIWMWVDQSYREELEVNMIQIHCSQGINKKFIKKSFEDASFMSMHMKQ